MSDSLKKLNDFYKAQTIRDPMAIATYVTTRYGIPDEKKYSIARGIAGKSKAKEWNPVQVSSDTKRKEQGSMFVGDKGGNLKVRAKLKKKGTSKKSIDLDKAQTIRDSTRLAHHLAGGGSVGAGEKGQASIDGGSWAVFEGGLKDKGNAKRWNPIMNPDIRGYKYTPDGKREKKKKKEKKEPQARVGKTGKFGSRGKSGKEAPSYQSSFTIGGKKIGEKKKAATKAIMNSLLYKAKKHKFGGKPLGWEELPRDPISFATNVMQDKGFVNTNLSANTDGAKTRNNLSQGIRALINKIPDATKKEIKSGKRSDEKWATEAKKRRNEMKASWEKGDREEAMNLKKQSIPPALASLLGFGAGWAMSDTFTEAPRGQMTPSQQRQWERLVRSSMRRKKDLQKNDIDGLRTYYKDSSDTYTKRTPIINALDILKDHAPVPPRQGLMFDPVKHRWTSQEKIGRTVSEVQGKKRIRGTGTGQHEHSRSAGSTGGKGAGMSTVAGRRFRSAADAGIIKPHEAKHPATRKITRKKLLQHLRGRAGARKVM